MIFSLYLLKFSYPSVSKCVYTVVLKIFFEESEEGKSVIQRVQELVAKHGIERNCDSLVLMSQAS